MLIAFALSVALLPSAVFPPRQAEVSVELNLGAALSEDDATAKVLERSLNAFLTEARAGEFTEQCIEPKDLDRYEFFFKGLRGLGKGEEYGAPSVLKSYTYDEEVYFVTVAFTGTRAGAPFIRTIVELKATPLEDRYRFTSPFQERTADLRTKKIRSVTFHHRGPLDEEAAASFVDFRDEFCAQTKTPSAPLDYYVFQSLDELLKSYGFVHDANKCNFLAHDLGFADDGGRVFVTGSNKADYVFEFVNQHLEYSLPEPEKIYWPFTIGMSAYYGGYSLSGDTTVDLKRQFREKLEAEPDTDFLVEFKKARKSSVQRHFSQYVMSAFLCEEVLKKHSFDDALALAYSGKGGETFFAQLESILGVTEANFHATILRLIAE